MKHINFLAAQRACLKLVVSLLDRKVRNITLPMGRVGPSRTMAFAFAPACNQRRTSVTGR
ncbi:hypothetical protein [Paraburkholderia humisilvae]|uniref:Uncharacterized protein n=1 Tax=Paraburkholderia humisilvae TaxID=627669 RepID=A0A6J5F3Y6_9BURK|nr:hypothetical protein [Paraburkholderia humisilvae]CAB3772282.1 hypothetical protein LMG29542_06839 [Paraburkholderia humisilvae]